MDRLPMRRMEDQQVFQIELGGFCPSLLTSVVDLLATQGEVSGGFRQDECVRDVKKEKKCPFRAKA